MARTVTATSHRLISKEANSNMYKETLASRSGSRKMSVHGIPVLRIFRFWNMLTIMIKSLASLKEEEEVW